MLIHLWWTADISTRALFFGSLLPDISEDYDNCSIMLQNLSYFVALDLHKSVSVLLHLC